MIKKRTRNEEIILYRQRKRREEWKLQHWTRNIYISSSAAAGGDGSYELPYNGPSDINWTTGEDNSIFDWVAAGIKVYINLKKGDVFNERLICSISGINRFPIAIQSYGSGVNPIIKGVVNRNDASDWSDQGSNIWTTNTKEVGTIPSFGDELVANGIFDTDYTGWTASNATLSIVSNALSVADDGAYTCGYTAITTTAGIRYRILIDVISKGDSNAIAFWGNTAPDGSNYGAGSSSVIDEATTGSYTYEFKATATTTYIILASSSTHTVVYDNVSVKQVPLIVTDIANILSDGVSIGWKKWNTTLTTQGDFFSNQSTDTTYMYSVGNPGTFYADIEMVTGDNNSGIEILSGVDYINISGIDIKNCGFVGIQLWEDNDNIHIDQCNISWCGGQEQVGASEVRNGGGINIEDGATNSSIVRCDVSQSYDAGIALQGYASGLVFDNIIIKNNLLYENTYNIEMWATETDSDLKDIYIVNNTFLDAGGWSQAQRSDPRAQSLRVVNFLGSVSNIQIKNNLLSGVDEVAGAVETPVLIYAFNLTQGFDLLDINYNSYYRPNSSDNIIHLTSVDYTLAQFDSYKVASSQDANSIDTDPDITSIGQLETGSPALNTGVAISGINDVGTLDLWGNAAKTLKNIGAYNGEGE